VIKVETVSQFLDLTKLLVEKATEIARQHGECVVAKGEGDDGSFTITLGPPGAFEVIEGQGDA
jgi:hypothetical protein